MRHSLHPTTLGRRDDGGAILILALVMITVFAALAVVVIQYAGTSFRRTAVVRDRVEKTAAANAGIRFAIEQLGIDPTTCAQPTNQVPGAGTIRLPTMVLDREVDLTCTWAGGLPSGVNGWAMAITGENVGGATTLVETQGGSDPKPVVGPIYLPSTSSSRYDLKKPITIESGNVVIRQGSCGGTTTDPTGGDFQITSPSPPYGFDCTTQDWDDVITRPVLPALPPPAPIDRSPSPGNQYFQDVAGCRIFYPGTYSSAAEMPLGSGPVYLASGVYYLNNFGRFVIDNAFIGGQPGPSDVFVMRDDAGSCASVSDSDAAISGAPGVGGTGVTLVLGGSGANATRIALEKGQLELFRRTSSNPDDPLTNVSVLSVPADAPGGWAAHEPAQDALVFETKPGNNTDSVVHGTWFTPTGGVEFGNITGKSTDGQFLGGLVASRAILQSSASVAPGSFIIRTDVGPFTRDLILESRARGQKSDMVATVVLSVSNETGRPVAVRSWRLATG
jgi:hypothetical protein